MKISQQRLLKVIESYWIHRLIRFGYLIRGVLYALIGLVALKVAIGLSRDTVSTSGVLALVYQISQGRIFLIFVFIGLLGYSLWGIIRALQDYIDPGVKKIFLFNRIGYLVSAFSYSLLLIPTYHLILAHPGVYTDQSVANAANQIIKFPFGAQILILAGLFAVLGGLWQIAAALKNKIPEDFRTSDDLGKLSKPFLMFAKAGVTVRGLVFVLMGYFIFLAGVEANISKIKEFSQVLSSIYTFQGGPIWLGILGIGLIFFGIYSLLMSYFIDIN
jgi:hypothetical protein